MSVLENLGIRAIVAPMAGGPSTPELVVAASKAGAFGFLAAGYLTNRQLTEKMKEAAAVSYGVNLFAPTTGELSRDDTEALLSYRQHLLDDYQRFGVEPPSIAVDPTDGWEAKLAAIYCAIEAGYGPQVVSVTFGLPPAAVVDKLHRLGCEVWATVTTPGEAEQAAAVGVDALTVQSEDAGGHRATFRVEVAPDPSPLPDLVAAVHDVLTQMPLVAAGGIATAEDVRRTLQLPGVQAVAVGTALLLSDEAGTSSTYREGLISLRERETVVTRAFSGRLARGLRNHFIDEHHRQAPALYPQVNALTSGIRRAATRSGQVEYVSLWAGTGVNHVESAPAGEILRKLFP